MNTRKTEVSYHALPFIVLLLVAASSAVTAEDSPRSQELSSLLISDGSRFVPKDFYPKFSWDTTPRYFMFGDKNRVLRPEQVRFIAEQTDFLCKIGRAHV